MNLTIVAYLKICDEGRVRAKTKRRFDPICHPRKSNNRFLKYILREKAYHSKPDLLS